MPKGTATGIRVGKGATANITREGNARMIIDAKNGYEANGIAVDGTLTLNEQGRASMEIGHQVRTSPSGSQNNGEGGKAAGVKIMKHGKVTANRKGNASMLAMTSDECDASTIDMDEGAHLDLFEKDNAIMHVKAGLTSQDGKDSLETEQQRGVVPQGQSSQGRNDSPGAEQRDEGDGRSVDAERHQESVMDKKGQHLYED